MDKLTRAEKRLLKQQRRQEQQERRFQLELKQVSPKTTNQESIFREFQSGKNLLIHGLPGTGKTFLSIYLALHEMERHREYKKIIVIRSVVPSRDMGFLPGSVKEKSAVYEAPYQGVCNDLFGRGDAYEILKQKGTIEFVTSSFLRGITIDNAIVIVDECQNMNYHELCTIVTRLGKNSRVIFAGDYKQSDFKYEDESMGVVHFMKIISSMRKYFSTIEMEANDIVRSGLVKEFIIRRDAYENPRVVVVPPSYADSGEAKVLH